MNKKVILITGASSGIGYSTAKLLLEEGHIVYCTARRVENMRELQRLGGKVVADIAKLNGYKEIIFLDDDISKRQCGSYLVVGTTKEIKLYIKEYDLIVAIGNNFIREKITRILDQYGIKQRTLIHPSAVIDDTVTIEEGTVVMANVVINDVTMEIESADMLV